MNIISKGLLTGTLASTLIISGCASGPNGSGGGITNDQARIIAGSVIGGVVGHQFGKGRGKTAATILGAIIGGYVGSAMNNQSRQRTNYALDRAPDHQPTTWTEPQTNNQYTVTPTNTYNAPVNGQQSVCRDYTMDAYIDGRLQQVKGRACKDASGQWVAVR
ncbi:MAG: glycine zipper 2TM domain-containing protein [Thiotrichaceae bacterium]